MKILYFSLSFILLATLSVTIAISPALSEELAQKNPVVESKKTFIPPEVAVGTISCKAEWNEFCEDQKKISVPDGHKLCKNTITEKEKTGDSSYEVVSTDNQSVTIKFHAKGNRDRFKQQGASIVLGVSLLGVRENVDCLSGLTNNPVVMPKTEIQPEPKPAPVPESTGKTQAATVDNPVVAPANELKPHACACSQWIDADKVFSCLTRGHGRDNASCDSYAATIQCVASKEECHESQVENCPQVMGLNRTTSNKRLFVIDSPYCQPK